MPILFFSFIIIFPDAITSLVVSKQNYFLVECLMLFGAAPGRNLFRAASLSQTDYMSSLA